MLKLTKSFHVLGVVLFFGSILGHAVAGLAETVNDSPETRLLARQVINVATLYLTIPGMGLLLLSGIGLVVRRQRPLRNLAPHLILVSLTLLNAVFILLPAGQMILQATSGLADSGADLAALDRREAIFGAINILLCLVAVFVGVIKPGSARVHS